MRSDCDKSLLHLQEQLQSIVMSTSVCRSVSLQGYLRNQTRDLYQNRIFVHVAYGHGSVLFHRRCDTLCTFVFLDDIILFYGGPYSSMNFHHEGPILLKFTYLNRLEQDSVFCY